MDLPVQMEQGFEDWGFPHTKHNRAEYLRQYQFLFPRIAAEVCPEVFYWPSSASSGGDFETPNSPDKGDWVWRYPDGGQRVARQAP